MCNALRRMIQEDLIPYVTQTVAKLQKKSDTQKAAGAEEFLSSLREMLEDIEAGFMDEWECGELYETFRSYRQSGDFLDKIA